MPKETVVSGYSYLRGLLRDLKNQDHTALTSAQFRAKIDECIRAVDDLEEDDAEGS